MNKRETVWLIVRLIGVYFFYLAVVTLFSLVSSISVLYSLSASTTTTPEVANTQVMQNPAYSPPAVEPRPQTKVDPLTEKQKSEAFKTILFYVFLMALYGGTAFYLCIKGRLLFDILSNESSVNKREANPTVTTLKL